MSHADLNDTQLFYTEFGTGLPCLVMHMGLGFDHTCIRSGLDPLADLLRLIYYDHRGNGRSSRPSLETITFSQLADDADRLREHLHLDQIALLGHSFGGFIALHYALRYPHRLTHLILTATAPAWDYAEEILLHARRKGATPEMLAALDFACYKEDDQLRDAMSCLSPLYFYRFDDRLAANMFKKTIYCALAARRGEELLEHYNVVDRLPEITVPTLILAGERRLHHSSVAG